MESCAAEAEMSLTAISSLESARRKFFMNPLESARRKFFMNSTYIMSRKMESNVFVLRRPK